MRNQQQGEIVVFVILALVIGLVMTALAIGKLLFVIAKYIVCAPMLGLLVGQLPQARITSARVWAEAFVDLPGQEEEVGLHSLTS
jgi:hypothetical protein